MNFIYWGEELLIFILESKMRILKGHEPSINDFFEIFFLCVLAPTMLFILLVVFIGAVCGLIIILA